MTDFTWSKVEKKIAHNAPFDRAVLNIAFGWDIPWDQWYCTMAQAYAHGLPASLASLGRELGVSRERARQLEARAKRKLAEELKDLAPAA